MGISSDRDKMQKNRCKGIKKPSALWRTIKRHLIASPNFYAVYIIVSRTHLRRCYV